MIIFDYSSKSFRYWIDSHLITRIMHFFTHSFQTPLKTRPQFRMYKVSSEDVPRKLIHRKISHFNTIFYPTRSRMSTGMNSTSKFSSRCSLQNAPMIHSENSSLKCRSYMVSLFSSSEGPFCSTVKSQIGSSTMFLSFLFRQDTDSLIIHKSKKVLLCTGCIM